MSARRPPSPERPRPSSMANESHPSPASGRASPALAEQLQHAPPGPRARTPHTFAPVTEGPRSSSAPRQKDHELAEMKKEPAPPKRKGRPKPMSLAAFQGADASAPDPFGNAGRHHPHGTTDEEEWRALSRPLAVALRQGTGTSKSEHPPPLFIAGSAATGRSFANKPGRPSGTPFDKESDFDLGIASPDLYGHVEKTDSRQLSRDDGPAKTRALGPRELDQMGMKTLADAVGGMQRASSRKVTVAIFEPDTARQANAGRQYIERPHTPPRRRSDAAVSDEDE